MAQTTQPSPPELAPDGSVGSGWRQLAVPVAVLAVFVVLGRIAGQYWSEIQGQVVGLGWAGPLIFAAAFILLTAACFPVSALGFSAGALFGPWIGMGIVFGGGLVSGAVMFWLGKGLLRARVARIVARKPRLTALDNMAADRAVRLNLLTRLSPFNYGLASYTLAAGRSSFRPYALGLLAILPSVCIWVWLGAVAGESAAGESAGPTRPILLALGLVFFAVLTWQIGRMVRRAWAQDSAGPEAAPPASDPEPAPTGFWKGLDGEGGEFLAGGASLEWHPREGTVRIAPHFLDRTGHPKEPSVRSFEWVRNHVHPADVPEARRRIVAYLERRSPECVLEFRFRCADQSYIWLHARALASWNRRGRFRSLSAFFADITRRVEMEEERDRLFNLSRDLLAIGDYQGSLQQVNPAWVRILGWSRDDLMSQPMDEFVHEDDQDRVEQMYRDLEAGRPVDGLEMRFRCRNGEYRWLSWSAFPYPGRKLTFSVVRDITRQKEAEAQLLEYQEQLRSLSHQLSTVEDRQRRELAAALHDGLAQQLFGIRAQVTLLKFPDRVPDQQTIILETLALLDETLAEARSLSFELFPPALADAGLTAALEWLAAQVAKRTGLEPSVRAEGREPELPEDLCSMAYQCARELLANAHKHGGAQKVKIEVRYRTSELILIVADDGAGFQVPPGGLAAVPAAHRQPAGFGLFSIRERLRSIGGDILIDSAPGQGCRVTLVFPLPLGTGNGAAGRTGGG